MHSKVHSVESENYLFTPWSALCLPSSADALCEENPPPTVPYGLQSQIFGWDITTTTLIPKKPSLPAPGKHWASDSVFSPGSTWWQRAACWCWGALQLYAGIIAASLCGVAPPASLLLLSEGPWLWSPSRSTKKCALGRWWGWEPSERPLCPGEARNGLAAGRAPWQQELHSRSLGSKAKLIKAFGLTCCAVGTCDRWGVCLPWL